MRFLGLAVVLIGLSGCAINYQPPAHQELEAVRSTLASKEQVLLSAKRVLIADGYQITGMDDAAGIISTAPKSIKLSSLDADCGTTMGLDYLKDNRTSTKVSIGVIYSAGKIQVKATIAGDYRPGDVSQDMDLSCVSLGNIESRILDKISSGI